MKREAKKVIHKNGDITEAENTRRPSVAKPSVSHSLYLAFEASAGRRRPRRPGFQNSLFPAETFRPETPALYPRSLLTNHEVRGRKPRASNIQDREDVDVLRSHVFRGARESKLISKFLVSHRLWKTSGLLDKTKKRIGQRI